MLRRNNASTRRQLLQPVLEAMYHKTHEQCPNSRPEELREEIKAHEGDSRDPRNEGAQ